MRRRHLVFGLGFSVVACTSFGEGGSGAPAGTGPSSGAEDAGPAAEGGPAADASIPADAGTSCDPPVLCLSFESDPAAAGWTRTGSGTIASSATGLTPPAMRFSAAPGEQALLAHDVSFATALHCELDVMLETNPAQANAQYFGVRLAPQAQMSFKYWYADWGVQRGSAILVDFYESSLHGYDEGYPSTPWTAGASWVHVKYALRRADSMAGLRVQLGTLPPLIGPAPPTVEPLTFQVTLGILEGPTNAEAITFDNLRCVPQ